MSSNDHPAGKPAARIAEPLARKEMPTDFAISLANYTRRGTPQERRIPDAYDDYGLQFACQKIIAETHHTTGAFSDIKLIADEVV